VDFLVARDDLHRCRFDDGDVAELAPGQATLRVERFGLTSNNITYARGGKVQGTQREDRHAPGRLHAYEQKQS
jgi:hypothetical protein